MSLIPKGRRRDGSNHILACYPIASMKLRRPLHAFALLLGLSLLQVSSVAQWTAPNPILDFEKQPDGLVVHQKTGTLRFLVYSPVIVRLTYSPTASFKDQPNPAIIRTTWPAVEWSVQSSDDNVAIITAALKVVVDRKT